MKHNKPLVVKAGSATRRRTVNTGGSVAERVHFLPDTAMLSNMSSLIDVEKADATVLADKEVCVLYVEDAKTPSGCKQALKCKLFGRLCNFFCSYADDHGLDKGSARWDGRNELPDRYGDAKRVRAGTAVLVFGGGNAHDEWDFVRRAAPARAAGCG
eukprot:SAG31_NODE_1148_length_9661_cov_24.669839_5_plen_157_part_00